MEKSERVESVQFTPALPPNLSGHLSVWQAIAEAGRLLAHAASLAGGLAPPSHASGPTEARTLLQAANELLTAKARAARRPRYLTQLRSTLKAFLDGRAARAVSSITALEIETWLCAHGWAPKTRLGYLTDLRTLFNFAVKRGYLQRAPTASVERPLLDDKPPGILTVPQATQLMRAC